jgi:hypothetical protein
MKHLSLDNIYDYLHKKMNPDEEQGMKNHIESCNQCKSLFKLEKEVNKGLKDYSNNHISPDFVNNVMNRIENTKKYNNGFSLFGKVVTIVLGFSFFTFIFYILGNRIQPLMDEINEFLNALIPSTVYAYSMILDSIEHIWVALSSVIIVSNIKYLAAILFIRLMYFIMGKFIKNNI